MLVAFRTAVVRVSRPEVYITYCRVFGHMQQDSPVRLKW